MIRLSNNKTLAWLVRQPIKDFHFRVASLILTYRNEATADCFPAQSTMCSILTCKQQHLSKIIQQLVQAKILFTIKILTHRTPLKHNQYYFSHDWGIVCRMAKQKGFKGNLLAIEGVKVKLSPDGVLNPLYGMKERSNGSTVLYANSPTELAAERPGIIT